MGVDPTTGRYPGMVYRCPAYVALLIDMYRVESEFGVQKIPSSRIYIETWN